MKYFVCQPKFLSLAFFEFKTLLIYTKILWISGFCYIEIVLFPEIARLPFWYCTVELRIFTMKWKNTILIKKSVLFYILPKIHKPRIPGRPIVSQVNSITENISEFLTYCIQPLRNILKSHIKDSTDFLTKMFANETSKNLKKETFLVSMDIVALYTNIPHDDGINTCLELIEKYREKLPSYVPNKTILKTLFLFVLKNNYFLFKEKLYKQIWGTSMGTKLAPAYADLFLGKLEEKHILVEDFEENILFYKRFLDDIFLIWEGSLSTLKHFFSYVNTIHPNMKFTHEFSRSEINFLDMTIYKSEAGELLTKLYVKPTDTGTLLHYTSYHPNHMFANIIYTQALRYRLLTTDDNVLYQQLKTLKIKLLSRGYPKRLIKTEFSKIKNITQNECLQGKRVKKKRNKNFNKLKKWNKNRNKTKNGKSPSKNKNQLAFIIPYNENFKNLMEHINRHWHIIENDPDLKGVFPTRPFIVYKRHKNLKDMLIRTKFV